MTTNSVANLMESRIYIWDVNNPKNHYSTKNEAKLADYQFFFDNDHITYQTGTYDEYQAVLTEWNSHAEDRNLQAFQDHINLLVRKNQAEIKCLNDLLPVLQKFDGKVINKRFHDAVEDATGWYNRFSDRYSNSVLFELFSYDKSFPYGREPEITIYNGWKWGTNDSLNTQEAETVIRELITIREQKITELQEQPKQLAEYLNRVHKLEEEIKTFGVYPYELRDFCKDKLLNHMYETSTIWR